MKRVFLIGFMGSGKSTVGQALRQKYGLQFVDTDQYIEAEQKRAISAIFAEEGEDFFRDLETAALKTADGDIVSTGGGIVERAENGSIMKERGEVVFLSASFEEISRRLQADRDRPLWKQDDGARKALFDRRQPLYRETADHVIETNGKTAEQIAEIIHRYLTNA